MEWWAPRFISFNETILTLAEQATASIQANIAAPSLLIRTAEGVPSLPRAIVCLVGSVWVPWG
jgi:hypothetical protein